MTARKIGRGRRKAEIPSRAQTEQRTSSGAFRRPLTTSGSMSRRRSEQNRRGRGHEVLRHPTEDGRGPTQASADQVAQAQDSPAAAGELLQIASVASSP
jgi:hypothetical protein